MPYLHPSTRWILIIFSRSGRNSAYSPHALLVLIFCTICSPVSSLMRWIFWQKGFRLKSTPVFPWTSRMPVIVKRRADCSSRNSEIYSGGKLAKWHCITKDRERPLFICNYKSSLTHFWLRTEPERAGLDEKTVESPTAYSSTGRTMREQYRCVSISRPE